MNKAKLARNSAKLALSLLAALAIPAAALADEPAPEPSPAALMLGNTPIVLPFDPVSAPRELGMRISPLEASIGGTEQGLALRLSAQGEAEDGSIARIELRAGAPVLMIRGRAEALPLLKGVLYSDRRPNSECVLEALFTPASGNVQASLPFPGNPSRSHVMITPEAAAKLGCGVGPYAGTLRLRGAPAAGVLVNGDGLGYTVGGRLGWDAGFKTDLDSQNRLELDLGIDKYLNAVGNLADGGEMNFNAKVVHTLQTGQQASLGVTVQSQRMTITRADGGASRDGGQTSFGGVTAGLTW